MRPLPRTNRPLVKRLTYLWHINDANANEMTQADSHDRRVPLSGAPARSDDHNSCANIWSSQPSSSSGVVRLRSIDRPTTLSNIAHLKRQQDNLIFIIPVSARLLEDLRREAILATRIHLIYPVGDVAASPNFEVSFYMIGGRLSRSKINTEVIARIALSFAHQVQCV